MNSGREGSITSALEIGIQLYAVLVRALAAASGM
jgi:hypothetical protein